MRCWFPLTKITLLFLLGCICPCTSFGAFDDSGWHQFRGPTGEGRSNATLPTDLTNKAGHVWTAKTKGIGWSSPVVLNGQVWFTSAVTREATPSQIASKLAGDPLAQIKTMAQSVEFHAICLDVESGKEIHNLVLATENNPDPINPMNSYASPTAVIAGDRVICHFGNYGTWCLSTKTGETIWSSKLVVDHSVGPGSSPIVFGNNVILVCDGVDQQYIAALSLHDGKQVWKTPRPPIRATNGEFRKAYSTPLIVQVKGSPIAVIPGAQWTAAYNPSNGEEIWRVDCGNGFSTTPMAIFENGLIVISTGYTKPEFVAIRPDGQGDVTQTHIAWRSGKGAPTMPSAIATNGTMYAINDSGILSSYEVSTGAEKTRNRIGGDFSASPILAGDKLYISSRKGVVTIVQANNELNVVSKNDFGSPILASPAVIGNDLILRTEEAVFRITSK